VRQAEWGGGRSDSMGGMVQFRRSSVLGAEAAAGRVRTAIKAPHAATTAMAIARPVRAGASRRCGTMVVAVSSADKPSRAPITTLAAAWCSAAVGVLAGAGYLPAAAIAAVLVLAGHLALRPVARRIDRLPAAPGSEVETTYQFRAVTRAAEEAHIRTLIVRELSHVSSVTWATIEPEAALLAAAEE
jgi:uncharacterized membrane protein YhiD involved in acid resistance